ncbi:hypothetical protein [Larsenimonas rhizosphaerae]|uniref:hypothetical protein n=1 Tax=Larsenimonas rhizosphaerae TaxID=2944682 RepID=UPI0020341DA7|nr:hypothetical protein [Larsenimonas rhizosphaerae]MCM2131961.1 hypothetical protein [Larsenimonas rhizosphaerae]
MDLDSHNGMTYAHCSPKEYLELRASLEQTTAELDRLKKQRAATERAATEAGKGWRSLFKAARGKSDTKVRQLQRDEHASQDEVAQLDELIDELQPQADGLRVKAGGARSSARRMLWRQRQSAAQAALTDCASAMLATDEGPAFLAAFKARLATTEREALDDTSFMMGAGFEPPYFDGWYASVGHFPADQQAELRRHLSERENRLLCDLVRARLPEVETNDSTLNTMTLPELLPYEASEGSYATPLSVKCELMRLERQATATG